MRRLFLLLTFLLALFSFLQTKLVRDVTAAITNSSRVISYQGRLTDSSGNNVADGTYSLTFKIYTVSTGGSASFTETNSSVSVSSGLFSVLLGSLSANGVNLDFANPPYYLGITVGANAEMSPRIQLGFVPLAHNAQYLDGNPASAFVETSGQIAFFATTCPTGWSEYTAARGRVVVGNPASGTLAGTVGTALTNLQNPTHTHTTGDVTLTIAQIPSHSHTQGFGMYHDTFDSLPVLTYDYGLHYQYEATTGSTGGGGAHNHGATGATSATPPYIQLTACQKN